VAPLETDRKQSDMVTFAEISSAATNQAEI
jgi:hypothetical protein